MIPWSRRSPVTRSHHSHHTASHARSSRSLWDGHSWGGGSGGVRVRRVRGKRSERGREAFHGTRRANLCHRVRVAASRFGCVNGSVAGGRRGRIVPTGGRARQSIRMRVRPKGGRRRRVGRKGALVSRRGDAIVVACLVPVVGPQGCVRCMRVPSIVM